MEHLFVRIVRLHVVFQVKLFCKCPASMMKDIIHLLANLEVLRQNLFKDAKYEHHSCQS